MLNKYIFLILFVLFQSSSFSQEKIGFDYDFARFNYDEKSNYLELYYSFDQQTLRKKNEDGNMTISASLDVKLTNQKGDIVINKNYNLNTSIDSSVLKYNSEDLIGVIGFQVPYGQYKLNLSVSDNYFPGSTISVNENVEISSFTNNEIKLSDIQFCRNIIQDGADDESLYFKNGLEAIPNPSNLFGFKNPVLFYYSEIYCNSSAIMTQECRFERVTKKNNSVIDSHKEPLKILDNSILKAGFVNISGYGTGRFSLTFNILDKNDNLLASNSKNFYVFNPNVEKSKAEIETNLSFVGSEFGTYNEEECDYNFEIAKYVAVSGERDLYESLKEIDAKRKFLFEFWKKRDIFPETIINEYKNEYMERLSHVNSKFSHRNKKGYKTDQGRVYLIYGKPDRIESRTNMAEKKPFEIWQYDNIEGGVFFVFGDTMGITEYELLHSTKRGELVDNNWERRIKIKGSY